MAKLTLLQIVQSVLNATEGDEVNTISGVAEAESIALVAKEVYEELMAGSEWPHLNILGELESLSDVTRPMVLKIPELLSSIEDIKYDITTTSDTDTKIKDIYFRETYEFLTIVHSRNTSESNISTYNVNGVPLFIKTDEAPTYWTTFDDELIIFDSFDSAEDTTLQSSKSIVLATKETVWVSSDGFIPDLPSKHFPAYLARVKAKCFNYQKQEDSKFDIEEARRGKSRQKRRQYRSEETIRRPSYGRSRKGGTSRGGHRRG